MQPIRFRLLIGIAAAAGMVACEPEEAPEAGPAMEAAPAPEPVRSAATTLDVATALEFGAFLTDDTGRAVYLLEADPPDSSTCYDACAQMWPPVLTPQATPNAAGPIVRAEMIGSLTRRDGPMQVTYNGHPLYYYSADRVPGEVTGHVTDEWGEWYLVTPEGEGLRTVEEVRDDRPAGAGRAISGTI